MYGEKNHLTVLEQLHMAALVTYTNSPLCEIDYEDENGRKTLFGSVMYFTNNTVCLKDGRTIKIKNIRKVTC